MLKNQDSSRDAPIYNIKAVARLTGVPADTLRRWESRYDIISPQRTEGGYRKYSRHDIDVINWLKGKLEEGLSISSACEMLRGMGGRVEPTASSTGIPSASSPAHFILAGDMAGLKSFEVLRTQLMDTFRNVDEIAASSVVTDALALYTLEDVCLQIMQPVLIEVGLAWEREEISVAVEHFASNFVRTRISNLFHSSRYSPDGPLVLVACAPDELHEVGPLFLAVFLRRAGFKVVYLGQNVPFDSLEGMIAAMSPQVVCVSAARFETATQLYRLRDFLDVLAQERGKAPLLAYGGQAFNHSPQLTESLGGTYLGNDASEAVRQLSQELRVIKQTL